jgi:hypothetical protein
MLTKVFTGGVLIAYSFTNPAHANEPGDSTQVQESKKKSNIRVTARLHSMGFFGYGGQIANENPVVDVNFTYERKAWSFLLFKAADLYDGHSHYNFTLALLYKNIHIGNRLTFTPNFGFALGQQESICDKGSDAIVLLLTSYKPDKHFTIDHCARFGNVLFESRYFDWLNRLRLTYTNGHMDTMIMGWHNNNVFDNNNYVTLGASMFYSRIAVSKHVMLSTGITGLIVAQTSDEENCPRKNGMLFTIAAAFD